MRLVIVLLLILSAFFLVSCSSPYASQLDRAYSYLSSVRNPDYLFDDGYLKFIYPDEHLECGPGSSDDCIMTYRKLDAYFDLVLIGRLRPDNPIGDLTNGADRDLRALIPLWRGINFSNTLDADPEGMALDTFCILGYLYKDEVMADNAVAHLSGLNWMDDSYYSDDVWRNIADESWCVLLLQAIGKGPVDKLVQIKVDETRAFISGDHADLDKAAVLLHMLMILNEDKSGKYAGVKGEFVSGLRSLSLTEPIISNTLMLANIISVLHDAGVPVAELSVLVDELVSRQSASGAFYPVVGSEEDNGQAFTTLRVIIALERLR